jgi:peptidoglycan biosynthesis protein MviN/MurJ (putative lipid II flippase)
MLVGVLGVFIYIASALLLMPRLHIFGLALANTIQNSAHGLILLALLFTAIGTLEGRGVLRATGKAVVGGAVAAGGAAALAAALHSRVNPSILTGQAVEVMLPVAAAVVLYVGAAAAMRSQELELVWEIGRRKLA